MVQHNRRVKSWMISLPRERKRGPANQHWRELDPEWSALQLSHLAAHPACAARSRECEGIRNVHHVCPRHLYPELRLYPANLVTLCERHHLALGHGGDFCAWLPQVRELAEARRTARGLDMTITYRAERERIYHRIEPDPVLEVEPVEPTPAPAASWWSRLVAMLATPIRFRLRSART